MHLHCSQHDMRPVAGRTVSACNIIRNIDTYLSAYTFRTRPCKTLRRDSRFHQRLLTRNLAKPGTGRVPFQGRTAVTSLGAVSGWGMKDQKGVAFKKITPLQPDAAYLSIWVRPTLNPNQFDDVEKSEQPYLSVHADRLCSKKRSRRNCAKQSTVLAIAKCTIIETLCIAHESRTCALTKGLAPGRAAMICEKNRSMRLSAAKGCCGAHMWSCTHGMGDKMQVAVHWYHATLGHCQAISGHATSSKSSL